MASSMGTGIMIALGLAALGSRAYGAQQEDEPRESGRLGIPPAPDAPRSQDITLGYRFVAAYPQHLDRDNIASEAMAAMDLLHWGLQDSGNDELALRALKWGLAGWVDVAVMYVAHEYGHISSISKTGFHDAVAGGIGDPPASRRPTSPEGLFLEGLQFPVGRLISVSEDDWGKIDVMFAGHPAEELRFSAMIKAGGINEEQILSHRYADRLMDGDLSYLDTLPFFWGALSTLTYPTGIKLSDIDDYVSILKQEGLRTSATRVKFLSAVSFLSGSAAASAWGGARGLFTASGGAVRPIAFDLSEDARVFLPEFDSTLSQIGPTVKTSIPVKLWGWLVRPSYEALVITGERANEAGVEVRGPLASFLSVYGIATAADHSGDWLEGGVEVRPFRWFALTLGYAYARGYTFHRDLYGSSNDVLDKEERSVIAGAEIDARF